MVKSDKNGMKKGPWSEDEDNKLRAYIQRYGHWNWALLPKFAGVSRSGKSCRLRWVNYLRPNIKHGNFTEAEDNIIMDLRNKLGNKWSTIARNLPGRTDNEIKNRWNSYLRKRAQNIVLEKEQGHNGRSLKLDEESVVERASLAESPISSISIDQCIWDYAVSSDHVTHQAYDHDYEPTTNFWTDPFISDDNHNHIISSGDRYLFASPMDIVDHYISNGYSQDMVMANEFLWSALDLCNESFIF
ncbi:hypothetical protein OSB04_021789 [Centaurea solstitialis]|uniref:Uncharacterized protein n=1 Tax=Centaurea solstitialis TaxID=347529 RepID=A0AA38WI29_9ASTR|nr:hypothetical protein OSB04_021789 [Centaurea solstitialis]